MQQWEYCTLSLQGDAQFNDWMLNYYGGSGKIVRTIGKAGDVAMAGLGNTGWELVGVTSVATSTGGATTLYFKRPVEPRRRIDDDF